jgi:4,5-DOPA dioxygenase extradiol
MMNATLNDQKLPTLFVPHGSPMSVLRPGAAGAALTAMAASLTRLRAIVVVSAHWDTLDPTVGYAARPGTIHDFWGFPEELYSIRYPATGCREAADEVVASLRDAGFSPDKDDSRGLDHGAWIPLRTMFPDADVPVVPLSIQSRLGPEHHFAVGRALAPLAGRGILVLGSGNMTHNLRDLQIARQGRDAPLAYLREFPEWVASRLADRDVATLLDYRQRAPDAVRAHPTDEHLLPLYVALGAAGENFEATRFHAGIDEFVLAMDSFAFRERT